MSVVSNKSVVKKSNVIKAPFGDKVLYVTSNVILGLFSLIVLLPLINVVASSFSSARAVNFGEVLFWPVEPSVEGYKLAFSYRNFWRCFLNSVGYTVGGTLINITITMICAYPLARKTLPFRGVIMGAMMFSTMFGGGLIPTYLLNKSLGLVNNPLVLILPGAMSVHNMIIARTFIDGIPHELEEAAHIDGCSDFKFFFHCVIPLSKTVMAVLCLYYAVGHWNSYFQAFIYLSDELTWPLQMILRAVLNSASVSTAAVGANQEDMLNNQSMMDLMRYAMIVVSSVPILIVYPWVKKYFMKGVMIGSVKG